MENHRDSSDLIRKILTGLWVAKTASMEQRRRKGGRSTPREAEKRMHLAFLMRG